jgi:uncharacterized protein YoxC
MSYRLTAASVFWALWAPASWANMVVHDPIGWASNAVEEVTNYTLWLKHEADAASTELNTLHTYEQEIVQLARLGDPAALAQLTGVKDILAIYQDYAQITYDFQRMQTYFNPASYQYDMNSILYTYRQPNWQGMLAYGGTAYVPAAGNYQFATASFNTAKTAQQTIQSLTTQRQNLQTQRDSALQSLQSATTQSDVQKWTAVLQTLNSSISHIDAQIQQVNQQVSLQQAQLSAGQAVYQATQREQLGASMLNGVERDLGSFNRVTANYLQPVHWNNISGGSVTPNNATMNIPSGGGVVIQ